MAQSTLKNYNNNLFSNHFLEERIQEMDEWQEAEIEEKFEQLRQLYQEKKDILTNNLNEDQTQDNFIDPILRKLGHDWVTEASKRVGSQTDGKNLNPDYAFMNSSQKLKVHRDNEEPLELNYAVGDAKAWNRTLDKSSQDHTNPAFQIYNYVDRLRADWGILTNGKKWRLYSYEKCAADIYFEVDLESLLSGEKTEEKVKAFKYFYLFFRADSFDVEEKSFLEKVYQESVNFAEGLEDDLEDKVYDALEVAVEGFFETNDIEKTEENIDLVHHASLIFLYRILFILNAESRDLLPTDDEAYRQAFGLTQLKRMIVDDEEDDPLFQETTVAWDNRLSRLFEGIDDGYELYETEIPAYNGGLFDPENGEENQFLAKNKLYGSYIKKILKLLATNKDEEKEKRIILDYKDLNIRHLGSVYEGLLEHQFKAAGQRKVLQKEEWKNLSETDKEWQDFDKEKRVEENELYLTNESGERKATGSYYTPEYIVEYIVKNTVGPKVEEKVEEAEQNGDNVLTKILELNICDPAMGSGHFLTEATEFIAESIVEHADLEEQEINENEDELNWAKRQVVQNCIYGVDINPLAVELGKLSLWIETMAEGKPLNFLDHHLKHGNSLIGSDFDDIFSHPTEDQKRLDSDRYKFGDPQDIKENFQKQYLKIEEMPENTVEQIHKKEQAYKEFISENLLYQQFQQIANIHTRQYFKEEANSSDYESFLINVGNPSNPFDDEEFFQNAQEDAESRNYFHWKLEFPKVFFGETQGFDAVVGNPPYVRQERLKSEKDYFDQSYESFSSAADMYVYFMEKSVKLLGQNGIKSFIVSNKFVKANYARNLREWIAKNYSVREIIDLSSLSVFGNNVNVDTSIISIQNRKSEEDVNCSKIRSFDNSIKLENVVKENSFSISSKRFGEDVWVLRSEEENQILNKLQSNKSHRLEEYSEGKMYRGILTGLNEAFFIEREKGEKMIESNNQNIIHELIKGDDVRKYGVKKPKNYVIGIPSGWTKKRSGLSDEEEAWEWFCQEYPKVSKKLEPYEEDAKQRYDRGEFWWELRACDYYGELEKEKIVYPDITQEPRFAMDTDGRYILNTAYTIIKKDYSLLAVLNSQLIFFYLRRKTADLGDSEKGGIRLFGQYMDNLPVKVTDKLNSLGKRNQELSKDLRSINLNIQDYLGNYSDGETLGDLYSPVEGLSDEVVSDTSTDRDSLRIGSTDFEERNEELILKVSARYKPEDSESIGESELDQWGYTETDKVPAMKFTGLSKEMRSLVREFTELAVDKAGGFANFRESATKTNSIIDRLEKLTLPKLSDVDSGLEKFVKNREEAQELEEEIQETDELIDAIVFDLYDLTEEEVETVLDSLDSPKDEKSSIFEKFGEV